jgi:hypothetical protein
MSRYYIDDPLPTQRRAAEVFDMVPLESLPITWLDGGLVHQMVPEFRIAVCELIPPLMLMIFPPCGDRCPGCFDPPEEGQP